MIDVLVAGAGYVGLSTALSIKNAAPHLDVTIVDPVPADVKRKDERWSAIAAAAAAMLSELGVWDALEAGSQPVTEMIVTDSLTGDPVRPVFLTFDQGTAGRPFAHMVSNKALVTALAERAETLGVEIRRGTGLDDFDDDGFAMEARIGDREVRTRLIVAADGIRSPAREKAGIRTVSVPYDQMGIVATVAHEREHHGAAYEHFLPSGPFATLPIRAPDGSGTRSSLVWTEPTSVAKRLVEGDEFAFELELERRFGLRFGNLELVGPRNAYPLGLTLARDFVRPRLALVGDAAHGIHPIAGQGLNLGFKDAAALAQTIVEADRLGLDIGALDVLEGYQRWRRFDTVQMGVATDVLNRLFSNDNVLLRRARQVGLGIVDRLPGLKRAFIDQAAGRPAFGQGGDLPNLLRGLPI